MTSTKRPAASEIAELLSNNPRLISPCIDVPMASVQVERTDSLEMIPSNRKPSGSLSVNQRTSVILRKGQPASAVHSRDNSSGREPYSPLNGIPNGSSVVKLDVREPLLANGQVRGQGQGQGGNSAGSLMVFGPGKDCDDTDSGLTSPHGHGNVANGNVYVPHGYIMLDHRGDGKTLYVSSSISSC